MILHILQKEENIQSQLKYRPYHCISTMGMCFTLFNSAAQNPGNPGKWKSSGEGDIITYVSTLPLKVFVHFQLLPDIFSNFKIFHKPSCDSNFIFSVH